MYGADIFEVILCTFLVLTIWAFMCWFVKTNKTLFRKDEEKSWLAIFTMLAIFFEWHLLIG